MKIEINSDRRPLSSVGLFLLIAMSVAGSGCTTTKPTLVLPTVDKTVGATADVSPISGKPMDSVKATVEIDKRLLVPCVGLPKSIKANPSPEDVLKQKAIEAGLYAECRDKNRGLLNALKAAFNIQD